MESVQKSDWNKSNSTLEHCNRRLDANQKDDDCHSTESTFHVVVKETKLFLELAVVTSLLYLGMATCPLLTAACVGRRFGPLYLSAFCLANLMSNLCTQTVVAGLLGAIDTLSPQAMGTECYQQVGILAVRGVIVSLMVLIPINALLVVWLKDILVACGEDPLAAEYAHQWYQVFVLALPFSIVYQSLCKFLAVQRILQPIVVVSVISTLLIWPTLEVCAKMAGFLGTAVAYVLFFVVQCVGLLAWITLKQPHDVRTWQLPESASEASSTRIAQLAMGFWRSSIVENPKDLQDFVVLGLGGVMAQCEWVFWEALGLVVGRLGIVAMTAHTIPTQVVFNLCTLPYACGIALAVRMGIQLPKSVQTAQTIALGVTGASLIVFGIASMLLYIYREVVIEIFVDPTGGGGDGGDENAININAEAYHLAESIWPEVSLFNLNCALFGILAGISSGLGKQWVLGTINVVCLWVFGMPMIYYKTTIQHDGGLNDAWFWMNVAYLGINGSLIAVFVTTDWYQIQQEIVGGDKTTGSGSDSGPTTRDASRSNSNEQESLPATADENTTLLHELHIK